MQNRLDKKAARLHVVQQYKYHKSSILAIRTSYDSHHLWKRHVHFTLVIHALDNLGSSFHLSGIMKETWPYACCLQQTFCFRSWWSQQQEWTHRQPQLAVPAAAIYSSENGEHKNNLQDSILSPVASRPSRNASYLLNSLKSPTEVC